MIHYVSGNSGAIASSSDGEPHAVLWNPAANRQIKVLEVSQFIRDFDVAGLNWYLARTTTRGTPGSTVTPDADNSAHQDSAPPSGALLDLCEFSVLPTFATPNLASLGAIHREGSGFLALFPRGIWVPPGTGLAIRFRTSVAFGTGSEISYVFED